MEENKQIDGKARTWRRVLVGLAAFESLLAIWFVFCAFSADNSCYVKPCYEGAGLQELWKVRSSIVNMPVRGAKSYDLLEQVNKGIGLSGILAGILFLAYGALALCLVPRSALKDAPLVSIRFTAQHTSLSL